MPLPNNRKIQLIVLIIGICYSGLLYGQSRNDWEFILEAHKSIRHQKLHSSTKDTVLITYFRFHPVSVSNDTVSLYVSSTFLHESGEIVVETGRIIKIPPRLLPAEPLQLLVVPVVVFLNPWNSKRGIRTQGEFPAKELEDWKASGYFVREPMQISSTTTICTRGRAG